MPNIIMNPPQVYTLLWATEIATLVGVERDIKKKKTNTETSSIFSLKQNFERNYLLWILIFWKIQSFKMS